MKWALIVTLTVIVGFGCSCSEQRSPLMEDTHATKSSTAKQVSLTVSAPRKTAVGKEVNLSITLTNEGNEKIFFGQTDGYGDCGIRVIDSKGQACPFTPFGHQKMGGEPGTYRKYISTPLAPGESHTWKIDLAKCFQLKPGKYMVSSSIEVFPRRHPSPDKFTVKVDNLELEMEAAHVRASRT